MRRIQFKVRGSHGHDLFKRAVEGEPGAWVSGPWVRCTAEEIAGYEKEHGSLLYTPPPPPKKKKAAKKR